MRRLLEASKLPLPGLAAFPRARCSTPALRSRNIQAVTVMLESTVVATMMLEASTPSLPMFFAMM